MSTEQKNPPAVVPELQTVDVTVSCSACPVEAVTVFVDRAEVTRLVTFSPDKVGPYNLVVEGFSSLIDTDSIRVKGTGEVVILEVSYEQHTKVIKDEGSQAESLAEGEKKAAAEALRAKIKSMEEENICNNQAQARITAERVYLETFSKNSVIAHLSTEHDSKKSNFDVVAGLLEFNRPRFAQMDADSNRLRLSTEKLNEQIRELEAELKSLKAPKPSLTKTTNDVTIGLDVKKVEKLELRVVYMVSNASWTPSYDVRISTKDNSLSLVYYGNVRQSTQEDWKNTVLTLSTSVPSLGGSPPALPTKRVGWYVAPYTPPVVSRPSARFGSSLMMSSSSSSYAPPAPSISLGAAVALDDGGALYDEEEYGGSKKEKRSRPLGRGGAPGSGGGGGASAPPMNNATHATAEAGGENTTFMIARPATVLCDNKAKKVTVAMLNLESRFTHYTVPALSEHAYIKANTLNSSEFFLLASSSVSIFLDNNFVSTSNIGNVSPGEDFDSYLGVDPAVKIEQKPTSKVHSKKGFLVGKQDEEVYTLLTKVKNTKKVPLVLVIRQQLPISQDQKIKVTPLTPSEDELKLGGEAEARQADLESKGMLHSLHKDHPLVKTDRMDPWKCDGCHKPRSAPRYRCSRGCDFDLCEDCWTKENRVADYAKLDANAGILEWFRVVAPGKEIQIPYTYGIKWPNGQQIQIK